MEANDDRPTAAETRRVLLWVAAVATLFLGLAGWYAYQLWETRQGEFRDARTAGELHAKMAQGKGPLTAEEFDTALSLCDAADAETRFTALLAATAHAISPS